MPTDIWLPLGLARDVGGADVEDRNRESVYLGAARTFEPMPVAREWVHCTVDRFVTRATAGVGVISGLVLLLACLQLGTMVLARNAERRSELAVRLALGAPRNRLVRLLLAENVLVALAGAAAAGVVGWWSVAALRRIAPPVIRGVAVEVTPVIDVHTRDPLTLAAAALVVVAAACVAAYLPARHASRVDPTVVMRAE